MFSRKKLGIILCLLFGAFIPLYLWTQAEPLSYRFTDILSSSLSLGQILGLIGMGLFAVSLILSARLSSFESWFGGMNRVYIVHHQLGGIAFILLMLHPLALVVSYSGQTITGALNFFLPQSDWTINLGIASLLFLMTLLIITYYLDLPYELWRFTHKFLGIPFFIGGLHSLLVSSDISRFPPLQWYMIVLCLIGIIAYTYRTLLWKWLVPTYVYTVEQVTTLGDTIFQFVLLPAGEKILSFLPGQFVFVTFTVNGKKETHPFSISTSPSLSGFRISIKNLGDFTSKLQSLTPGSTVVVEGPYGRFSYIFEPSHSYVWVGGGIGITPFLSMAGTIPDSTISVSLYYCVPTKDDAVYLPELETISKDHPHLTVYPWFTKEMGHLDVETIIRTSGDIQQKHFFICGPPQMMKSLKKQLKKSGVSGEKIHTEEFGML